MHSNVCEWCADEWHDNYDGAPTGESVWLDGNKERSLLRGVPGQTFLLTAVVQFATSIVGATLTIILLVFVLSGIAG